MAREDAERWDRRWLDRGPPGPPAAALVEREARLPRSGRALDLAGGNGRHALWLAERGLEVTLADVSTVALEVALRTAGRRGLVLGCVRADLEEEGLPRGPWDLVLIHHFLDRGVLAGVREVLAPGGRLLMVHPTRRNLERHPRPSARFLLEEGELPGLLPGLEVLEYEEGWGTEGRHEAVVVAALPAAGKARSGSS